MGLAGIFLGTAASVVALIDSTDEPESFAITGTMTVSGSIGYSTANGFECEGRNGYSDISPTAAVSVSDENGTLLAKGDLTSSTKSSTSCVFDFAVADAPRGSKFYQVEVSHRGSLSYTEEEAESGLSLSLGD